MHGALFEKQVDGFPALESRRATIGEAKQNETQQSEMNSKTFLTTVAALILLPLPPGS